VEINRRLEVLTGVIGIEEPAFDVCRRSDQRCREALEHRHPGDDSREIELKEKVDYFCIFPSIVTLDSMKKR
jgi:hypothetical protein